MKISGNLQKSDKIKYEVYYVRFDMDWLEMIEISEIASRKEKGQILAFSVKYYDIEIYPYTL